MQNATPLHAALRPGLLCALGVSALAAGVLVVAKGIPDWASALAVLLPASGWLVAEGYRTRALVRRAAQEAAAPDDDRESVSEQVARAHSLMTESFATLRENFCAIVTIDAAGDDDSERKRHLDHAVIALQSEDTVGQLLSHAAARTHRLEQAALQLDALLRDLQSEGALRGLGTEQHARVCERIEAAVQALQDIEGAPAKVEQRRVAEGSVQLF